MSAIFPTAFAHFMSFCYIWQFSQHFKFFIIIIFVMMICDQWSLMLLLQKNYDLLKAQMITILNNKVF